MTRIIETFADISSMYDAAFVDLWGCLHDGVRALPAAVSALQTYRAGGGIVILVTNSPKPRAGVAAQLGQFNVPDDCYDTIATSGDVGSPFAASTLSARSRRKSSTHGRQAGLTLTCTCSLEAP